MRTPRLIHALVAWTSLILFGFASAAHAGDAALTLERAIELASSQQPMLAAAAAQQQAARERAKAAGQLPDPKLQFGFNNVSVDQPDPFASDAERMSMTTAGLMQEFPNRAKRQQQAQRASARVGAATAALELTRLRVTRDTGLAWTALWQATQARSVLDAQLEEAQRQLEASTIGYRSDRLRQSAVHTAQIEWGLLRDRQHQLRQQLEDARAQLARWIGDDAEAVDIGQLPELPDPPSLDTALHAVDRHPAVLQSRSDTRTASADVALAQAAYRPDWRVEAMYGYRRPYDDMVSLQFGIDLPLFTRNRQDPALAAARADEIAAEDRVDDLQRDLQRQLRSAYADWNAARDRLADYDAQLIPAAQARSDSALAAYRSGSGDIDAVLTARRGQLDIALMRIDLCAMQLRSRLQLRYLLSGE
ncbi:TolC family protein [Sinimarinibacterium sp. CAU 1509]|uniref:TolC family protein n=1 Tax=Sinimarinibacterium sp. CAU 1509 TaxID=2562283 RepID=UPI0010AD3C91|nr:TolC family protein [Sinimarinibacterium sp. CAU 1509]TJY64870.1 TolC family protein [Sinimarinibacterium sp. CAU 1509]